MIPTESNPLNVLRATLQALDECLKSHGPPTTSSPIETVVAYERAKATYDLAREYLAAVTTASEGVFTTRHGI